MVDLKRKEFKMLEIRKYTKNELSAVLETNTKQGIDRKLQRYGVEFAESASYGEIKKWFLNTYPQIKEYHNKLENILKKSA